MKRANSERNGRMKTTSAFLLTALAFCITISVGCIRHERGNLRNESVSLSELHKRSYQVLKSNVQGESYGFYFLVFPIIEPQLATAKQEMYQQVEKAGIKLEGHAYFLANTTEEYGGFNLLIFSIPRLTITADFMEFVGDEKPEKVPSLRLVP